MPRLTKDFKTRAREIIVEECRQHILLNFDKTEKTCKGILINEGPTTGYIQRNSFKEYPAPYPIPYFEDFGIKYRTTIENIRIIASFYLEWDKKNPDNLILAKEGMRILNNHEKDPNFRYTERYIRDKPSMC